MFGPRTCALINFEIFFPSISPDLGKTGSKSEPTDFQSNSLKESSRASSRPEAYAAPTSAPMLVRQ